MSVSNTQSIKKKLAFGFKLIFLGVVFVMTNACSDVEFTPTNPSAGQTSNAPQGTTPVVATPAVPVTPEAPPAPPIVPPVVVTPPAPQPPPVACTPVAAITRLTKIIFLVDTSGSNGTSTDAITNGTCSDYSPQTCVPATDPQQKFRGGSIQNFVNKYANKKNFQWGFVTFAGVSAHDFVGNGGKKSFTPNSSVMNTALKNFYQLDDGGDTPFGAALTAATNSILNDPDHNNVALNPQYFVIMLTDGYPTDFKSPSDSTTFVNKLLAAAPKNVSLSTIFYGPQNFVASKTAIDMLSGMAQLGSGQFANINNPKSGINIDDVIPGKECP